MTAGVKVFSNGDSKHKFGAFLGVFTPSVLTILGVIMYLRFGWVVAHAGLGGSLLIVGICSSIALVTAFSASAVATNSPLGTGGEYYMISRSFGALVGGTIGISLYLSQAISVAFYMIAFSEAFTPLFPWIQQQTGIIPQTWMISIPAAILLLVLIIVKGADLGVSALWIVVTTLGISLFMFFIGKPETTPSSATRWGRYTTTG